MQRILVGLILAATLFFAVRRLLRILKGRCGCECGCEGGCSIGDKSSCEKHLAGPEADTASGQDGQDGDAK